MVVDVIIIPDVDLVIPDTDEDVEDIEAYIAFVEDHGLVCTEKKGVDGIMYLTFDERR